MASTFTLQNIFDFINNRIVDASGGTFTSSAQLDAINAALRRIRRNFDLPSSEIVSQMTVYKGIQQYAPPSGLKDNISLLNQFKAPDSLFFRSVTERQFWEQNQGAQNLLSEARNGTARTLLINLASPNLSNSTIHTCDTYNGNGTWTANTTTSDASGVGTDLLHVWKGSGSVKFNITVAQSVNNYAEISNSTFTTVDLSGDAFNNIGTMTMKVWLPSAINYTSFTLRWGSSSANYYESTVTSQIDGSPFVLGWNTLGFDWTTASTTGTPVNSTIKYLLFRATYPASLLNQTNVAIDDIVMRQKMFMNFHYTTDFLVVDGTTGALKESFSSITDTSSYLNIDASLVDYVHYCVLEEGFLNYYKDPNLFSYYSGLRKELEDILVLRYPSQRLPQVTDMAGPDDAANLFDP